MKNFLCCLTFSSGKTPAFRAKIIQLSTWMRWPSPSVCQSLDLEKETFWCVSCFPYKSNYKVYFLYIKDIWFALPKYVQINLSLTSSPARPPQLLSFFEVKTIHWSNFQSTSLVRRKKERYLDLRGLENAKDFINRLKQWIYTCRNLWIAWRRDSTLFGVVDDTTMTKFTGRTGAVHCKSLPVVVVVLKFPVDVKNVYIISYSN